MAENTEIESMLEKLREQKQAIDSAIAALEVLSGKGVKLGTPSAQRTAAIEADTFVGLNIVEASKKYLEMVGRPARPLDEVANALNQGGLHVTQGSVSTILRRSENNDSPVVRVGRGLWGLASWYPNRPRRARQNSEEGE